MNEPPIDEGRRDLLRHLTFSLPMAALGLTACGSRTEQERRLTAVFADREAARRVGAVVLAARPAEADRGLLVQLLAAGNPLQLRDLKDPQVHEMLYRCHQEDLVAGRLVTVDGWMLTETEARLCALSALL